MSTPTPTAALLLAAGYGRRFGSDKRTADLGGASLLGSSLALPCSMLDEVWIVVRPDDRPSELGLPEHVNVVQHADTALGMGHSLAAGVRRLSHESGADCLALFLADMPQIRRATLATLLALASPTRIVVPTCAQRRGHPVLFGRAFWAPLCELSGDQGARSVLARFADAVELVETDDPGVLLDVDLPQDLQHLRGTDSMG